MPPPDHILTLLHEADWERVYPSLVAYAKNRLWLARSGGPPPRGMHPKDVVQEAIRLVFEGKRQWDPLAEPDVGRYLATSVIWSLISNAVRSADYSHRDIDGSLDMNVYPGSLHDPSVLAASGECEEVLRTIVEQATDDDERLATIQMGLEDGMRSAEIAKLLSIKVSEVYTLTRKLRRRIFSAMADHECWQDHPPIATVTISR